MGDGGGRCSNYRCALLGAGGGALLKLHVFFGEGGERRQVGALKLQLWFWGHGGGGCSDYKCVGGGEGAELKLHMRAEWLKLQVCFGGEGGQGGGCLLLCGVSANGS